MEVAGVTIGDRDGVTEIVPVQGSVSPERCHEIMIMLFAGRAAEELVFGNPSGGAGGGPGSDLSRATNLAKDMELRLGFGDLGPVFLSEGVHDPLTVVPGLLGSVRRRLDRAMSDAKKLLVRNRAALDEIADKLSLSGYLSAKEIVELVGNVSHTRNGDDPSQGSEDGVEISLRRVREQIEETLAVAADGKSGDAESPEGETSPSRLRQGNEERPD
jgi:ATP-dependent Zn protease